MIALEETIEFTKKQAKAIVESGEEHRPIMLVFTPEGITPVLLKDVDKDIFKPVISEFLQQLRAYAYIFINEAWATKLSEDSPTVQRLLKGEISVSELPLDDRDEMLIITAAENGKSYRGWSAKIRYTREGKRYLGEWEEIRGISTGRLILKEW